MCIEMPKITVLFNEPRSINQVLTDQTASKHTSLSQLPHYTANFVERTCNIFGYNQWFHTIWKRPSSVVLRNTWFVYMVRIVSCDIFIVLQVTILVYDAFPVQLINLWSADGKKTRRQHGETSNSIGKSTIFRISWCCFQCLGAKFYATATIRLFCKISSSIDGPGGRVV